MFVAYGQRALRFGIGEHAAVSRLTLIGRYYEAVAEIFSRQGLMRRRRHIEVVFPAATTRSAGFHVLAWDLEKFVVAALKK